MSETKGCVGDMVEGGGDVTMSGGWRKGDEEEFGQAEDDEGEGGEDERGVVGELMTRRTRRRRVQDTHSR
jgi:hypothetical protein